MNWKNFRAVLAQIESGKYEFNQADWEYCFAAHAVLLVGGDPMGLTGREIVATAERFLELPPDPHHEWDHFKQQYTSSYWFFAGSRKLDDFRRIAALPIGLV